MIQQFSSDLPGLAVQFTEWYTPRLPEIQRIARDAQATQDSGPEALDALSSRKSSDLAYVNELIAPLQAFVEHSFALATAQHLDKPPMTQKALAKGATVLYGQAYKQAERLSASLVHQLDALNSRVWKAREEIKAGLFQGRA